LRLWCGTLNKSLPMCRDEGELKCLSFPIHIRDVAMFAESQLTDGLPLSVMFPNFVTTLLSLITLLLLIIIMSVRAEKWVCNI